MRVSSRGTVSMGPLGWLIMLPVLVAFYVVKITVMVVIWLVAAAAQAVVESRAQRRIPR